MIGYIHRSNYLLVDSLATHRAIGVIDFFPRRQQGGNHRQRTTEYGRHFSLLWPPGSQSHCAISSPTYFSTSIIRYSTQIPARLLCTVVGIVSLQEGESISSPPV